MVAPAMLCATGYLGSPRGRRWAARASTSAGANAAVTASLTASAKDRVPSRSIMRARCTSTVRTLMLRS